MTLEIFPDITGRYEVAQRCSYPRLTENCSDLQSRHILGMCIKVKQRVIVLGNDKLLRVAGKKQHPNLLQSQSESTESKKHPRTLELQKLRL